MPYTLDDLARMSGVSRATISRALNGGPVAPATRAKVEAVVAETGYRPNAAARRLASGRTGVVGLVMHVTPANLFGDPHFGRVLAGITAELARRDHGLMLWLGHKDKPRAADDVLGNGLVDGLVVCADVMDDPLVDGLVQETLPVVLIGRRPDGPGLDASPRAGLSTVDVDNVAAMRAVTEHVLAAGARRLAHLGGPERQIAAMDREAGFRAGVAAAGVEHDAVVETAGFGRPDGRAAMARVLDRAPDVDAVVCVNDAVALGALDVLREAGRRVPDDVLLTGFDDVPAAADVEPSLTTVRQSPEEHGAAAVRLLFEHVLDGTREPRHEVLPTELVPRRSTQAPGSRRA